MVPRIESRTHSPAGDFKVFDPAVGLKCGAETVVVDSGNNEVSILRFEPEQLVANRAPDEIRVEAEPAYEVFDGPVQ
jgi:hypothetical protein